MGALYESLKMGYELLLVSVKLVIQRRHRQTLAVRSRAHESYSKPKLPPVRDDNNEPFWDNIIAEAAIARARDIARLVQSAIFCGA